MSRHDFKEHYRMEMVLGHTKNAGEARRKGVNMDVILSSLSLMAASLLALVRGIATSIIIMQAVVAAVMW